MRVEASTCAHTSADSNLAFVCDLGNRSAVEKLLTIKRSKDSKRMAILCRSLQVRAWAGLAGKAGNDASQAGGRLAPGRKQSAAHAGCVCRTSDAWRLLLATAMWPLCCQRRAAQLCILPCLCLQLFCPPFLPAAAQDVDRYTLGWPPSRSPGQPDMFKLVRRILPGPVRAVKAAGHGGAWACRAARDLLPRHPLFMQGSCALLLHADRRINACSHLNVPPPSSPCPHPSSTHSSCWHPRRCPRCAGGKCGSSVGTPERSGSTLKCRSCSWVPNAVVPPESDAAWPCCLHFGSAAC